MTDQAWRVGIWCAVSSKPQAAEDKSSLQDQERAGRRFAATVGEAVAVYRVPGHSRTMWRWEDAESAMPAYRELRQDVEAQRIDVLWCLESSRLGRDAALVQQVVSLLESHGAELYRADTPHQLGQKSTGQRFLDAFGSVIAQQESETRKHRHAQGMRNRVKRGLFASIPPHGYEVIRDEQGKASGYEQTDDADAIRMITRLYLAGHSLSEIRRRMNESGYQPARSQFWCQRTVSNIVNNDSFAGYPAWGGTRYQGDGP
ncbi:MAG: recombinase family protein, partial [Anaerolineae bacterium]|nr:recombinase family protein [Anaerolineae bacterium]